MWNRDTLADWLEQGSVQMRLGDSVCLYYPCLQDSSISGVRVADYSGNALVLDSGKSCRIIQLISSGISPHGILMDVSYLLKSDAYSIPPGFSHSILLERGENAPLELTVHGSLIMIESESYHIPSPESSELNGLLTGLSTKQKSSPLSLPPAVNRNEIMDKSTEPMPKQ
jgi:hypothetical protein